MLLISQNILQMLRTEINTNVFNNVLRQQSETANEALKKAQETVKSKMN